jgi:hypothetical protein
MTMTDSLKPQPAQPRFVVRELGPRAFVAHDTVSQLDYDLSWRRETADGPTRRRNAQRRSRGDLMSSPMERAEQAVAEAREAAFRERTLASLDLLIRAVRRHDTELARGELLTDNTGDETDAAYNRGVTDAANAIEQEK